MEIPSEEPHIKGDTYAKHHPLPTISKFLENQKEKEALSKRQAKWTEDHPEGVTTDASTTEPSAPAHEPHTPPLTPSDAGHGDIPHQTETVAPEAVVTDDTQAAAVKKDQEWKEKQQEAAPSRSSKTVDVPIGDDKTNILFHPPPDVDIKSIFSNIPKASRHVSYVVGLTIIMLNWFIIGGGFKGLVKSCFPALGLACIVFVLLEELASHEAVKNVPKSQPMVEKIRYVPESVEWLNSLIDTVWKVVGVDVFRQVAQQVEDQVKAVIPTDLVKLKVADIGQGSTALRILSMRSLPDSEFSDLVPTHGEDKELSAEEMKQKEAAVEREEGVIFYNLEICLAYHPAPLAPHKKRIHFDIVVLLAGVPLPIFVETHEFVMTLRVRLQMHPDIPFLKTLTFALTEAPKVHASVALGFSGAINLLNLPFLDNFIESQIKTNTAELVQPKSMSIDMTPIVGGSDAKTETDAVGLLFLNIHRADNLAKQDRTGGGADPYITVSFSKYEKPMYATKMIVGDRNPVWEETACVLINADHIKRQEQVLIKLWDADRRSADDVTGQVEVDLRELVKSSGQMHKRQDQLQHEVHGGDAQGVLHWEIGYFPRAEWKKALMNEEAQEAARKADPAKPEQEVKPTALNTRPDPEFPTGILSVTVYQCINLEVPNPYEGKKSRTSSVLNSSLAPKGLIKKMTGLSSPGGKPRSSTDSKSAKSVQTHGTSGTAATDHTDNDDPAGDEPPVGAIEEGYLPSAYCTADVNDLFAMRTRVKSITRTPIFNSTVETFLSDWRNLIVTIAVRDSRRKDKDALIGAVVLKAADLFTEASTLSRWHTLTGGVGSGRVRIAILFRSTTVQVPREFLGWSVGRFEIDGEIITSKFDSKKLKIRTGGGHRILKDETGTYNYPRENTELVRSPTSATSATSSTSKNATGSLNKMFPNGDGGVLRVPVFHRYLAPVVLEFFSAAGDRKPEYHSIIWMHSLVDNETRDFTLTVYKVSDAKRYTSNVLDGLTPEQMRCTLTPVGTVQFTGRFKSGMCQEFKEAILDNGDEDEEDTFEVWEAMKKIGLREECETDTGVRHDGVVTGAGMARDPSETQMEEIKRGGSGEVEDSDVRNVEEADAVEATEAHQAEEEKKE